MEQHMPEGFEFDYSNADRLLPFSGTHPAVMQNRIEAQNWPLQIDAKAIRAKMTLRRKLLQWIEDVFGWRVGEYKNYHLLK
jgi:hypothetical protein